MRSGSAEAPLVRPLDGEERAIAFRVLDAAMRAHAGTIDRARLPRAADPRDRHGSPFRYFVAEVGGAAVAAAAFTPRGEVAEWGVPGGPHALRAGVELLRHGEAWARSAGAAEMLLLRPPHDPLPEEILAALGYRRIPETKTVLQVVLFPELLGEMLSLRAAGLRAWAPRRLRLRLARGLYPPLEVPEIDVALRADGVEVAAAPPGAAPDPQAVEIACTATALTEFMFGGRTLDGLFDAGLAIRPASAEEVARGVLAAMACPAPWYAPLGEHR